MNNSEEPATAKKKWVTPAVEEFDIMEQTKGAKAFSTVETLTSGAS